MILIHSDLIDQDFVLFLTLVASTVFALILGIAFHEACHAYMATSLGDPLPGRQGRTTLNPLAHLEPLGTILMLFVGFGWGKPVESNPFGLKISPKMATFLVSLAGPMSNFVVAGLVAIPIQLGWVPYVNPFWSSRLLDFELMSSRDYVGLLLTGIVYLNCILGVFNLIPIPPLDGFKVALVILPDDMASELVKLDRLGFMPVILVLFIVPFFTGYNPVSEIMAPFVERIVELFTGTRFI